VATIVAAYIQKGKQEAQSVAEGARFAVSNRPTSPVEKQKAAMIQQEQGVQVTLIFPGSKLFSESAYYHYSYVEVHWMASEWGAVMGREASTSPSQRRSDCMIWC